MSRLWRPISRRNQERPNRRSPSLRSRPRLTSTTAPFQLRRKASRETAKGDARSTSGSSTIRSPSGVQSTITTPLPFCSTATSGMTSTSFFSSVSIVTVIALASSPASPAMSARRLGAGSPSRALSWTRRSTVRSWPWNRATTTSARRHVWPAGAAGASSILPVSSVSGIVRQVRRSSAKPSCRRKQACRRRRACRHRPRSRRGRRHCARSCR